MADENLIGLKLHNEKNNRLTIESLQSALFALMKTEEFSAISITGICKKAGISRTAFYRNFVSKEDLLECAVEDYTSAMIAKIGSPFRETTDETWYRKMFACVYDHAEKLITLFHAGLKYKYLSIVNSLALHDPALPERERFVRLVWAGAIVNVIIDWADGDFRESPEKISAYCADLLKVK